MHDKNFSPSDKISQYKNIPQIIKGFKRWCVTLGTKADGKPDKAPKKTTHPTVNASFQKGPFSSYQAAEDAVSEGPATGLGFCHTDASAVCTLDLDRCYIDGNLTPYAQRLYDYLGTYTEFGQSGTGLHLVFLCSGFNKGKVQAKAEQKADGKEFELFSREGFIILTGNIYGDQTSVRSITPAEMNGLLPLLKDASGAKPATFEQYCTQNEPSSTAIGGSWSDAEKRILRYYSTIHLHDRDNTAYKALCWWWEEHPEGTADQAVTFAEKLWEGNEQPEGDQFELSIALAKIEPARKKAFDGSPKPQREQPNVKVPPTSTGGTPITISQDVRAMANNLLPMIRPWLFNRSGILVKLSADKPGHRRLSPLNKSQTESELTLKIDFEKSLKDKDPMPVACPPKLAEFVTNLPHGLQRVETITHRPAYTKSGTLLNHSGIAGQTVVDLPPELEGLQVPEKPTDRQCDEAYSYLMFDHFAGDFPFKDESSRLSCLAALITFFVREMIEGPVPATMLMAPKAGQGKTLLGELLTLVGDRNAGASTIPASGDEQQRLITSSLMDGNLSLMLDNVQKSFKSSHFASLLTSEQFRGKVLYQTSMTTFNNRLIILITGNGLILDRDMARRSIFINLADTQGRTRTFRHSNLRTWTKDHLGEIVSSVLSLVNAWVAAGKPLARSVLPSFEAWSHIIGGIINTTYAGGWDVLLEGRDEEAALSDGDTDSIEDLVEFIANEMPPGGFRPGQLVARLKNEFSDTDILTEENDNASKMGRYLMRHKGGIFGPNKLQKKTSGAWYFVEKINGIN